MPTSASKKQSRTTRKQGKSSPNYIQGQSGTALRKQFEICARVDLAFFCQFAHHGHWERARHLDAICQKLEAVSRGERDRLIITMPPRHGKSMMITESFPVWYLGNNPDKRVMEVSYSDSLSRLFGDKCRRKVEEFGYLWGIGIDHRRGDKSDWGIDGRYGGMTSSGVGGSITGKGADLLIIDDPVKNRMEADSQTYRNRVWSEWQSTLSTRLHPGAAVVVVLTRWHEDDLAGRLLKDEPDRWELFNLPAIAEEGDPLGRTPGEALWPDRYDEAELARIKTTVGSRDWEALYQGRPSPAEGSVLLREWWREYPLPPKEQERNMERVILSWDCTFKDSKGTDFVVGQAWGKRGADFFLLDQVRARMDFPATIKAVKALAAKWPRAAAKLVEDKANGPAVISTLKRDVPGLIPVEPEGGKVVRANAVSPYIEAGNVFLPAPCNASWVNDFIEECAAFPSGAHDDQVDAMTQALQYLIGKRRGMTIGSFSGEVI